MLYSFLSISVRGRKLSPSIEDGFRACRQFTESAPLIQPIITKPPGCDVIALVIFSLSAVLRQE
jgi:hypothetical protein